MKNLVTKRIKHKSEDGNEIILDLGALAKNVEEDAEHRFVSDAEKEKWNASESNVQADWNVTDTGSDAFIKNKPSSLPANGGNASTVNGHKVESDVPANAVFTDTDTKPVNMKGATNSVAGAAGYAPAPAAGAANRYLRSDGTWQVPPDHDTVYSHPDEHPASMITQDSTHRFVSDTEKSTWNGKMNTTGNGSNLTAAFSQAASRTNLTSGEKLSVLLGKIAKWFADLKAHAFSDLVQNATTASTTQAVSAAVAKNLQDQITEQNTKFPTLSGHTLRFDNGIQIYFMQLVQLTDNDANGYYKYFNFDQPFKDNLYCVQATNNTSNERVYMDNAYTAENRLLVRCASSVWVYVMCIGYWK